MNSRLYDGGLPRLKLPERHQLSQIQGNIVLNFPMSNGHRTCNANKPLWASKIKK